jgi:outer membrane receptor protein involved in Fe transport
MILPSSPGFASKEFVYSAFKIALCVLLLSCLLLAQQEDGRLSGTVRDQSGAAIAGATVRVSGKGFVHETRTSNSGEFAFADLPEGSKNLEIVAPGFALHKQTISTGSGAEVQIELTPASVVEEVVVTPSGREAPLSETAESVTVIGRSELNQTAAIAFDDALRQVPGFTLFRRSNSLAANPTSQGVSLRGVGASGASRALVLDDGIPLNDAFGGWVYWNRVPRLAVDRVEVLRGGASNLYGNDAFGGVINISSQQPPRSLVSVETSYGSQFTPDGSLFADYAGNGWHTSIAGEGLRTDGYVSVERASRGLVDTPVASRYWTGDWKVSKTFTPHAEVFASAEGYKDSRKNGTPLQTNRTALDDFSLGTRLSGSFGELQLRGFGGGESYHQSFSSIAADRNSETLARLQAVPSQHLGARLQWSRNIGELQSVVAGAEVQQLRGLSDEIVFVNGNPTTHTFSGGRQLINGYFGQDTLRFPHAWILAVSGRIDQWENYDASTRSFPIAVGPSRTTLTPFADRHEVAFSPRLSLLKVVSQHLSLSASGYRAFRAPTLNELYRAFRLGNVLTQANDHLNAENLTGVEGGMNLSVSRLSVRANVFHMNVSHPITNVTLTTTPALITRQRQNLGRTSSTGVDLESELYVTRRLSLRNSYLFTNARVVDFAANRALEGLQVPQVARHQFTSQVSYIHERWSAALQARALSRQFEDDQNLLPLASFITSDAKISWNLRPELSFFVTAEGLGQRYQVARTPVLTLGPSTSFRVGVNFRSSAMK